MNLRLTTLAVCILVAPSCTGEATTATSTQPAIPPPPTTHATSEAPQPTPAATHRTTEVALVTAEQNDLRDSSFAFPKQRKEPLNDARHVRNAIARFDQVEGVTDSEREQAWKRIKAAAKRYGVEVSERSWRELMRGGKTG